MSVQTMSYPPPGLFDSHYYLATQHDDSHTRSAYASSSASNTATPYATTMSLHPAPINPSWRQTDRRQDQSSYLAQSAPIGGSYQPTQSMHRQTAPLYTGWSGVAGPVTTPDEHSTAEYRNLVTPGGLGLSMPAASHVPASPALTLSPPSLRRHESAQSPRYVVISTSPQADNHATSSYHSNMYLHPHTPLSAPALTHLSPQSPFPYMSLPPRSSSGASSSTLLSSGSPGITNNGASYLDPPTMSLPAGSHGESSMSSQQQQEETAYLLRRDTKERPPAHMIERQRRSVDWKSLRYQGSLNAVVEELLRMTTKNLKSPTDTPKRPMNAFMIYMSIRRPMIAKSNPRNVNGENSRILAREWTWFMPETEKQYWLDLADDYREEFKRRFPSFQYRSRAPEEPKPQDTGSNGRKRRFSDPFGETDKKLVRPISSDRLFSTTPVVVPGWVTSTNVTPYSAGYMDVSPGLESLRKREDYFSMQPPAHSGPYAQVIMGDSDSEGHYQRVPRA